MSWSVINFSIGWENLLVIYLYKPYQIMDSSGSRNPAKKASSLFKDRIHIWEWQKHTVISCGKENIKNKRLYSKNTPDEGESVSLFCDSIHRSLEGHFQQKLCLVKWRRTYIPLLVEWVLFSLWFLVNIWIKWKSWILGGNFVASTFFIKYWAKCRSM